MTRNLRRNLLLALALVAAVAGVALALAPHGHHHSARRPPATARPSSAPGDIQVAARYLGISRSKLRRRLRGGVSLAEVASATPGRSAAGLEQALLSSRRPQGATRAGSTQEQAERAKRLRRRIVEEVGRRRSGLGDIAVAARYLGLSEAALRARLLRGHSMGSIAASKAGASRAGLIALIMRTRGRRIEQALAARILTPRQERSALALLKGRATREVDRTLQKG
jgi:hypothetical protein